MPDVGVAADAVSPETDYSARVVLMSCCHGDAMSHVTSLVPPRELTGCHVILAVDRHCCGCHLTIRWS